MKTLRSATIVLAAAALALTGCGGGGDNGDGDAATGAEATGAVEIEAGDLYFDPEQLSATAGEIEFTVNNVGAAEHDLVIEEAGDAEVVFAAPGETASGTIELEAGTYTYYCTIPGHRAAGMEGTLEVS